MEKEKRGQISIEVLFSVGIMLLIFFVVLILNSSKKSEAREAEIFLLDRESCVRISDAIVYSESNQGFNTTLEFNDVKNVSIQANSSSLAVNNVYCDLPFKFRTRVNLGKKGISIYNVDGTVTLS
ncbi:MAG: hypothetical protein AABX59_00535 [Nanoarchaeota archaeon]